MQTDELPTDSDLSGRSELQRTPSLGAVLRNFEVEAGEQKGSGSEVQAAPVVEDEFFFAFKWQTSAVGQTEGLAPRVSAATDPDGWMYASRASNFDKPRDGGRGKCRPTDFCRRRYWVATAERPPPPRVTRDEGQRHALNTLLEIVRKRRGDSSTWGDFSDLSSWVQLEKVHKREYSEFVRSCQPLAHDDASHVALLRLALAMVYARASYGYPMARGHMASISAQFLMAGRSADLFLATFSAHADGERRGLDRIGG